MENLKNLWDKFTDNCALLPIHPQYFLKRYENTGVDFALRYAKGVLLDVGCGRMIYKKKLLPKVEKYITVDSPKTAKFYKGEDKPDIFADATNIPLPTSSCNTILLLQVLEHLPDPQRALKELARLLAPGGILVLSTVQSYPLHNEPYDFYRFTKYGLRTLLKNSTFKTVRYKEEGNIFILSFQNLNIYLMLLLRGLLETGQFGTFVAIALAPLFLTLTTLTNLIGMVLSSVDKYSKFPIVQTVVAKKLG